MQAEKIINIKKTGKKRAIDITIKSDNHIFYGNGIATSNSHSVEYGMIGYYTAYAKHHFPLHFYASYLAHSKEKQDSQEEVRELLEDSRSFNINIVPPHIISLRDNPNGDVCIKDNQILFGIIDIKGIGYKQIYKLYETISQKERDISKPIEKWSWEDFMFNIQSTSTVINNLILVGATPGGKPRKQKAYEYSIFQKLTKRELEWVCENYRNYENLGDCLDKYSSVDKKSGGPSNYKRKDIMVDLAKSLKNSPFSTKDHPDWIVANERELIGLPITYSATENKMIDTGMTCNDFLTGKRGKINILVEIVSIREHTIKEGQNAGMVMCFLELKDSTANISGVMFSESYKENQEFLFEGNVVVVNGFKSKKDPNSLIVNKIVQV